ncbi:MAG: MBL fold metallo-hydrolase [Geminicoccaceae bacterium]|nr:MBL fold metallo-hydrolase [Geminicoccaceae bacterium]
MPAPNRLNRRRSLGLAAASPLLLAACGGNPGDAPPPGAPWHHVAGGFRNPKGSPVRGGDRGDWYGFLWRGLVTRDDPNVLPPGHVLDAAVVRKGLARHGDGDSLTWLGHASFLLRLGGRRVLTDPFLTDYASPLQRVGLGPRRFAPPGLRPEAVPPVDLLLLSHNHYDHMDLMTLERLPGLEGTVCVLPLKAGRYVDALRFERIVELDWWGSVEAAGLKVTLLPSIHFSARGLGDRNESLWGGFLIETAGKRVYFAGDTAYGPIFPEIGKAVREVDLALVPIGAYDPRPLMRASHCTPEEAVRIGRDLGAERLAAMHWGTIRLTDEPPFEPPTRFLPAAEAAGYKEDGAWVMAIGETRGV